MKIEAIAYNAATKNFLENFDIFWNNTINSLGLDGAQLKIGNRLRPQISLWGYLATITPSNVATHDYSYIANVAVSIELVSVFTLSEMCRF